MAAAMPHSAPAYQPCDRHAGLPRELLRDGISVRLRVTGRSMAPYLADNDLVTLEPVGPQEIRLGDLVYTQEPGSRPLLHRVVDRVRGVDGEWTVRTKGDANCSGDPAVHARHVAGRVVSVRRVLPCGACRDLQLTRRHRLVLQRGLALGSRLSPRSFAALSRRLVPRIERLSVWFRQRLAARPLRSPSGRR